MPRWLRNAVMMGVFLAWGIYLGIALVQDNSIPLYVWTVPGATAALLSNKITGIQIGSWGLEVKPEEDNDNHPHPEHTKK